MDPIKLCHDGNWGGAFKGLKVCYCRRKRSQDMTGQLVNWGKAFSDFTNIRRSGRRILPFGRRRLKGSDEETAIEIFANKKKNGTDEGEEIKDHISWNYGPSAWKEVLAIEARMRKQRKDELYRKQEQIDAV